MGCRYGGRTKEAYIWPILTKVAQLVFLYRTHRDLVFHGFYLDKCTDLIESFHAIHSFLYVELETRATEADKGPFLAIFGRWTCNENGAFYILKWVYGYIQYISHHH